LKRGAVEAFGVLQLAGFVVSDGLLESLISPKLSELWTLQRVSNATGIFQGSNPLMQKLYYALGDLWIELV